MKRSSPLSCPLDTFRKPVTRLSLLGPLKPAQQYDSEEYLEDDYGDDEEYLER